MTDSPLAHNLLDSPDSISRRAREQEEHRQDSGRSPAFHQARAAKIHLHPTLLPKKINNTNIDQKTY